MLLSCHVLSLSFHRMERSACDAFLLLRAIILFDIVNLGFEQKAFDLVKSGLE